MLFQPGEGPSRGLLCACEIFTDLRFQLYCTVCIYTRRRVSVINEAMSTARVSSDAAMKR